MHNAVAQSKEQMWNRVLKSGLSSTQSRLVSFGQIHPAIYNQIRMYPIVSHMACHTRLPPSLLTEIKKADGIEALHILCERQSHTRVSIYIVRPKPFPVNIGTNISRHMAHFYFIV
jgi:hypothetical protein